MAIPIFSKFHTHLHTQLGPLLIQGTATAITHIHFGFSHVPENPNHITNLAAEQLEEYFCGKRRTFSLPLSFRGTPFQEQVWHSLINIPYGVSCSYADLAYAVGNPKASRAVGSANGKNPISIVIPCHRVIASHGGIGGYSGGLDKKKALLNLEGIAFLNK